MTKEYSEDIRQLLVKYHKQGYSCKDFSIPKLDVQSIITKFKRTGHVKNLPLHGGFEKQVFFKLPKLEERVQAIPGSIQGFGSKVGKNKIGEEEFNKPFSKLANTEEEFDSFGRQLVASDYKMRKEIEFQQPPQQSKKRRHISATCAVASCPSPADTSYHNFPKDSALLRNWVKACKRKDKFNPKKSRICSNHFSQDCYERDLRNELLGLPLRRLLKKGSVPSVNLYNSSISSLTIPSKRTKRSWRREIHQTIQPFLAVEHQDSSERIPQIVEIL
nr:uncharacterized protein LOC121119503 [Lepeophtheirus salmonis]